MAKRMGRSLSVLNPFRALRRGILALRNWRRGFDKIDYIMLTLPTQMQPFSENRSWLQQRVMGKAPLSLNDLERIFRRIGDDPRPKGVILNLRGLQLSLANLQNLRNCIVRLREKGKRVICFAQSYDNATYFIASVCDEIILQPTGEVATLGLRAEATFLKDALDTIGVRLESVAISPYKGAFDSFTRNTISPEGEAQLNWLLDSQYDILVNGIAEGREQPPEVVHAMIDNAPHLDEDALKAGYVDGVLTEEALHRRLRGTGSQHILSWSQAEKKLFRKWRKSSEKYVALLHVSGTMMPGESLSPPIDIPIPFIGGERAGDITVVQQVRGLMKNKAAAAVILYIDSPGGAVITAEAMTAALAELAQDRPLVVYMNSVAASGGYYIATPAKWIVAQPGTITGSIGVISGKAITTGLFEKLRVKRLEFTRGANATFISDTLPFTDEQRIRAFQTVKYIYQQFVDKVARSRNLSEEAVDAVGGGRVWTGAQAKANGLVDELGDLYTALKKARELANLPDDTPLVLVQGKSRSLPAQLAEEVKPAAALEYLQSGIQALCSGAPLTLMPFIWK
jgi:protease-4